MTSAVYGLIALALLLTCAPAWAGQIVRSVSGGREVVTIVDHGHSRGRPAVRTRASSRRVAQQAAATQSTEGSSANAPQAASVDIMAAQTVTAMLTLRLLSSPTTDFPDIGTDPTARELRLLGAVPTEATRDAVAAHAMEISGLPAVRNELQVLSGWEPSAYLVFDDQHVQERVELALLSWPELHAADIDVAVDKGITTLTGSVATADQRTLASAAAQSAVGVYLVQNRLSLQ